MKYDKLISYFENDEGVSQLLENCKEHFDVIDDISGQLLGGVISTVEGYKEALNQLTGIYMALEPIFKMSEAYKLNKELTYFVHKKRELEEDGKKVVATALEKESSQSVSDFRRIRNILEGYVNSSEKGIITCQTQLKRIEEKKYKPGIEENG